MSKKVEKPMGGWTIQSLVALAMGVVILVADVAWLVIGNSYVYAPWLILGAIILVADLIWLGMDISLMKRSQLPPSVAQTKEEEIHLRE